MNIEFRDAPVKPTEAFDIIISGKNVGEVKLRSYGYYVCINTSAQDPVNHGLVQGHGETIEAAIQNAFKSSREKIKEYLDALSEMETAIYGKSKPEETAGAA